MKTTWIPFFPLVLCVFLCCFRSVYTWDSDELELFDLVEEVNQNFYNLLELSQTATAAEVRKAYRHMSLKYHPDKNKDPNAEEMFRKIVAVAEVLKDDEKRKRYDLILQNGLPDWRQPVYYYRRVRKMGLWEMSAFLFALITVGQYLVAWSVYWERKYELEEVFMSKIRKKEKKAKKGKTGLNVDDYLTEHLNQLPKPRYQDLLVVRLATFLVYLVRSTPSFCRRSREFGSRFRQKQSMTLDESEDEKEERVRKPRKRAKPELPDYSCIFPTVEAPGESDDLPSKEEKDNRPRAKEGLPWSDADYAMLQKATTKFPVGTSQRWEKIAEMMDRSVNEVTRTVKQMKSVMMGGHVPTSLQGITGSAGEFASELPPVQTEREDSFFSPSEAACSGSNSARRPSKKVVERTSTCVPKSCDVGVKKVSVSSEKVADDAWSQHQQRALELALQQFPKGTEERWERIAKCVPGKTKEECMLRFKTLAELVRKKKMAQSS